MSRARFAGYEIRLPGHPFMRIGLGILLVGGGLVGFLPILGFWMIPLGLVILSVDLPPVRRFRRRFTVRLGHWLNRRWPNLARRLGFGEVRTTRMN
jgi:hypothetical protein